MTETAMYNPIMWLGVAILSIVVIGFANLIRMTFAKTKNRDVTNQ